MSSKIRESARGEACQMRLPCCKPSPEGETTVYAHLNGGGMGAKVNDIHGFYACFECHVAYDQNLHGYDIELVKSMALAAVIKTQKILLEKGLM